MTLTRRAAPYAPAVVVLSILSALASTATAQTPEAVVAAGADPTVALVQTALGLGPAGVLALAAYLLSRWQPQVVIVVRLDDAELAEVARLRRVAARAAGHDDVTEETPVRRPRGET